MATLSELQNELAQYKATESRILASAQSATHGDRQREEARLQRVQEKIKELELRISSLQNNNRINTTQAVFGGHRG
jgi:hypothetical protein